MKTKMRSIASHTVPVSYYGIKRHSVRYALRRSFRRGVEGIFDIAGSPAMPRLQNAGSDRERIAGDWRKVGIDIRVSIDHYSRMMQNEER